MHAGFTGNRRWRMSPDAARAEYAVPGRRPDVNAARGVTNSNVFKLAACSIRTLLACSLRDAPQEFSLLRRCCSFNLLRYDGPPIAAVPGKARFLRAQTSSALYGTGRTIDRQWIYQAKKDQASRNNRAQQQDVLPRLFRPVQFALLYEVFVVVPTGDLSVSRRFLHSYSLPPESACRWNPTILVRKTLSALGVALISR